MFQRIANRGLKTVEVTSLECKDGCSAKIAVALQPSLKTQKLKRERGYSIVSELHKITYFLK